MSKILFEACVDNIKAAAKASDDGAHRLELCSRLDLDGLTPDPKLVHFCYEMLTIPFKVMVRPRGGDFSYSQTEKQSILDSIDDFQKMGILDIVFGAIKSSRLDIQFIKEIISYYPTISVTVHKAIDGSHHPIDDINLLKQIPQVKAVLSSGGSGKATDNIDMLKKMMIACAPNIQLVIAGKVTQSNYRMLYNSTGCLEYHGRRIMKR